MPAIRGHRLKAATCLLGRAGLHAPRERVAEDFERHCPAMGRQEASAKICAQMESSLSRVESVRL